MQQLVFEFDEIMVQKSIESPNLDTTVGIKPHHLKGKGDMYIMPRACRFISRNQLIMVVEMKPKIIPSKNVAQAMGYVIAANTLLDVPYRPYPVGILTDFIDQWVGFDLDRKRK
jgi:hypothetical protein